MADSSVDMKERILRHSIPEPNSGCWLWFGYAHPAPIQLRPFLTVKGRLRSAHRLSYADFKGPIPSGLNVCHTCHNTLCVNPDHLYAGTKKQNTQDMMRAGRHFTQNNPQALEALKFRIRAIHKSRREARFCKRGHLLEGDNLYFNAASNRRRCKTCKREYRHG